MKSAVPHQAGRDNIKYFLQTWIRIQLYGHFPIA